MRLPWRSRRRTIFGDYAFASLGVAAVSGIALALAFDVGRPYDSVALVLLTNPAARFFRNLHYWSAQLFLILTALHTWDHLRRWSEGRVSGAVWARLTLSVPAAGMLMLSGFMLKADAEGLQAFRILTTAIGGIPFVGRTLSLVFFGSEGGGLGTVYLHHVVTLTLVTWLVTAEHGRRVWPRVVPALVAFGATGMASLFVAPTLHDGLDPVVKGPWYFLGLQELLHWTSRPGSVLAAAALLLLLFFRLPRFSDRRASVVKRTLGGLLVAYGVVCACAFLFRGENWSPGAPARAMRSGLSVDSPFAVPSLEDLRAREIPVVLGRREGCLFCHADTRGLSASHRADAAGCSSCHAGNPFSLDKTVAHRALVAVPGNLADAARSCGLPQCHPASVERVPRSIMATMSGIIAVDRAVFGETGPRLADVAALGQSAADTHLRQLCASCHLGAPKSEFGPIGQMSRGGGCNACHLNYSEEARTGLERYRRDRQTGVGRLSPLVHPDLSLRIGDDHCFGCHSRSGRISTSYEGWHERETAGGAAAGEPLRTLDDGRVFTFVGSDVHFERGMGCVDCHTSREVMGDGVLHARKSEQVRIECEDCHAAGRPAVLSVDRVDAEARRILTVRGWLRPGLMLVATRNGGDALAGTFLDAAGTPRQRVRLTGKELELRPPAAVCLEGGGHARLSCISCHGAWAPRCSGCHTRFDPRGEAYDHVAGRDVKGAWVEEGSDFRADPPALGVRTAGGVGDAGHESIDTFVPGMVLTVDRNRAVGRPPDTVVRRLYARTFSHTISARSRSCESCHNDPAALGYGRGTLGYEKGQTGGRWTFTPEHDRGSDGLPRDAWIGFLQTRRGMTSTREDVRPFNADEQKRILTVGACLTCHPGDSRVMRHAVADFGAVVRRVTPRCLLPRWD